MATELATAYVTLASSTKGLGKDLVAEYGKAGDQGATTFGSRMTSGLKGLAGGLIAALGVAKIAGFLGGYIGEAIAASDATDKFKQTLQFAGIKTTVIDNLTASTQKYADQTVYSLADIQNVTAQLAANGVKDYDKLGQAAGNLNAVAGGNADTFKSVAMMMTQTAGAGKLTTENWNQLADAIPGASGILQEAMRKNGAFTGDFRDAMAKGEITAEEFNQAIMELGMTDVAKEAATSTKTIEGAWGNFEATIVGGLSGLVNTAKPGITGFLNLMSDAVGSAFDAVNGWAENITAAVGPIGQAFEVAFAALTGNSELNEFDGIFKTINNAFVGLNESVGPLLADLGAQVGPILAELGPGLLGAIQPLIPVIGQLISGFAEAGPGLSPFMIALQAIQPIIPQLVATVASLATALASVLSGAVGAILPVLVQLGGLIATHIVPALTTLISAILPPLSVLFGVVAQVIVQVLNAVMPLVSTLLSILIPVIGQLVTMLAPLIAQLATALVPAFQLVGELVGIVAGVIASTLMPIIEALMPVVTTVFGVIVDVISAALTIVTGIIKTVMSALKGDWSGAWEGIKQILSGVWDGIKAVVTGAINIVKSVIVAVWTSIQTVTSSVWGAITGFLSGLWSSITGTARAGWDRFKSAIITGATAAVDFVKGIPGKIINALAGLGSKLLNSGKSLIDGFTQGIRDAAGRAVQAAKDMLGSVRNLFPFSPAKEGPFSGRGWVRYSGQSIGAGLADGMEDEIASVKNAALSMTEAAQLGDVSASFRTGTAGVPSLSGKDEALAAAFRSALDGMRIEWDADGAPFVSFDDLGSARVMSRRGFAGAGV